jgi:catechol 2,3-dioxygenase-like lactoylglutathione lyase family enzyme
MSEPGLGAFSHVTVGVANLDTAISFWRQNFGLKARMHREGPDTVLGTLWGIDPYTITRQAIVGTPTGSDRWAAAGAMHLVEFRNPLPPVRQGAKAWDLLPKNLDLYTTDLPTRYAELEAAGHQFRARWAEMPAGEHMFREVQMPGHDGINVVLIEVTGPGYETTFSPKAYAGVGPLVTIVPDAEAETFFYRNVLGMATTIELQLGGPAIEAAAGLPPGARLDLRVFGDPSEPLGRVEIIEYQQLEGEDLYPRTKPPATGILHLNYQVKDLAAIRTRLDTAKISITEHGALSTLYGSGPILSVHSPAGFHIEIQGEI